MPTGLKSLDEALHALADPDKASHSHRFFKTGPGQYGEGDRFWGLTVPQVRAVAKVYVRQYAPEDLIPFIGHPIHEVRLAALVVWVSQYQKGDFERRQAIVRLYLDHAEGINNWDLVDVSAPHILGHWAFHAPNTPEAKEIEGLAATGHLWRERMAVLATQYAIRQGVFEPTLVVCEGFLGQKHDLIHKATGWMLREVGKRDEGILIGFLEAHAHQMPRTMLRYALEKLSIQRRNQYMTQGI